MAMMVVVVIIIVTVSVIAIYEYSFFWYHKVFIMYITIVITNESSSVAATLEYMSVTMGVRTAEPYWFRVWVLNF